jgi:hypothetical protein
MSVSVHFFVDNVKAFSLGDGGIEGDYIYGDEESIIWYL